MTFILSIKWLRPLVFVALFCLPMISFAKQSPGTDMRVVIDISGSMKKTDPENLRIPAVKLMLNLAKKDSRFGVWTFGEYVNMLVPHKDVTDQWRQQAIVNTEKINSVALRTNIGLALEKASLNQTTPDAGWDKTIVLLSDGKVDISRNKAANEREKSRILKEVIPNLRKAGFKVHSVALSQAADLEFLRSLAVETGGSFSIAQNADELLTIFVQASDKANAPEQVPLEGNAFEIDSSVKEFTVLIYRKPGSPLTKLVDPRGKKYSKKRTGKRINWFSDQRYDLVTVRAPRPGKWRLIADVGPDNRVTIVSDLSLAVEGLPDNVIEGERVTMLMYLSEQSRPITDPKFLRLMDITFSQRTESGELFEGTLSKNKKGKVVVPKNGRYTAKLGRTLTQGSHVFNVLVDGKTFRRKRTHRMMVHTDVLNVDASLRVDADETYHYLMVSPKAALVDTTSIDILVQLTGPLGEKQVATAEPQDGKWLIDVPAFNGVGVYDVLMKVKGVSANGGPFELVQGPYNVQYDQSQFGDGPSIENVDLDEGIDELPEELPDELPEELLDEDFLIAEVEDLDVEEPNVEEVEEPVPEEVQPEDEIVEVDEEVLSEEGEGSADLMVMAAIFLVSNLLLFGGGFFVYRKMSKNQDESELAMEEQIAKAVKTQAMQRDQQPAPVVAAVAPAFDEEETVMCPTEVGADELTVTQIQPQKPVPSAEVAEPQPTEEENNAYENTAEPMELDDDEFIEIDDEFDDLDDEMEGLDELDMMLSEQEEPEEDNASDATKKDPFVNDEFQLDSPDE